MNKPKLLAVPLTALALSFVVLAATKGVPVAKPTQETSHLEGIAPERTGTLSGKRLALFENYRQQHVQWQRQALQRAHGRRPGKDDTNLLKGRIAAAAGAEADQQFDF
jgi:hypothetical protein